MSDQTINPQGMANDFPNQTWNTAPQFVSPATPTASAASPASPATFATAPAAPEYSTQPAPTVPNPDQGWSQALPNPGSDLDIPNNPTTNPSQAESESEFYQASGPNLEYLPTAIKEELIVDWVAPSRIFKARQRNTFVTLAAMVFLICLILFFLNQFLLIAVAMALAFLYYVLNTVPPSRVKNQVTTFGVRIEDSLYFWEELGRFWIKQKDGHDLLMFEVGRWPFRLTLILNEIDPGEMTDFLSQILVNQEPAPSFFDKAADWIERNIPLENTSQTPPPDPASPPPTT